MATPSRDELVASAIRYAREKLGWEAAIAEDMGTAVFMYLYAPGATEQVIEAPLSKLRRGLCELGGPELYPATEEYDLLVQPDEENLLDLRLKAVRGECACPSTLDLSDEGIEAMEAWINADDAGRNTPFDDPNDSETLWHETMAALADAELAEIAAEAEAEANAWGELQQEWSAEEVVALVFDTPFDENLHVTEDGNGHVGVGGLHEDIGPYEVTPAPPGPKEVWQEMGHTVGPGYGDPDGIPHADTYWPEEPAEEEMMASTSSGRRIIARKRGEETMVFVGRSVRAAVKAALEKAGWKFYSVTQERANALARSTTDDIAVDSRGLVAVGGGRFAKADGSEFVVSKGKLSFTARTLQVKHYRAAGWEVS